MEVNHTLYSFQNVGTHSAGRSCALLREAAYGSNGYKCVTRRRSFNVQRKSEPENSDKESRVFNKCQNIPNEISEYGSDKYTSKGNGRASNGSSMRYPCKYCMKWFRGNYIKLHMMRHMGTLPHVCKICAKQFPFNSNLKVHFRRKHGFE